MQYRIKKYKYCTMFISCAKDCNSDIVQFSERMLNRHDGQDGGMAPIAPVSYQGINNTINEGGNIYAENR